MSDIFISYSRQDRDRAQAIAQALEKEGFTVWWDRKIPPGKAFDEVIQGALDDSRCVIVLWSKTSVRSDWVKEEAQAGAERGVLVPALIDEVPIPLGFGRIQTANLVRWRGDLVDVEFKQLSRSVAESIGGRLDTGEMRLVREGDGGGPAAGKATPPGRRAAEPTRPARAPRRVSIAILAVLLAAIVGAGSYLYLRGGLHWQGPAALALAGGPTAEASIEDPPGEAAPDQVTPGPGEAVSTPDSESSTATDAAQEEADDAAHRRTEAMAAWAELRLRESGTEATDSELLADYETLWSKHSADLDSDQAEQVVHRIADLRVSSLAFTDVERRAAAGDLTLGERHALWREYQPAARPGSPEAARAGTEIAKLEELMQDSASIDADDRFVTARGLRRDGDGKPVGPTGVGDEFRPGSVYVFAWVHSSGSERLKLEWRDASGDLLDSQSPRVGRNLADGYRIAYYKNFSEPGDYEVRLYNQQGHLIGRREFRIVG